MVLDLCGRVEKLIDDLNSTHSTTASPEDFSTRLLPLNVRQKNLYEEAEALENQEAIKLLDIYDKRKVEYFNKKSNENDRLSLDETGLSYKGI